MDNTEETNEQDDNDSVYRMSYHSSSHHHTTSDAFRRVSRASRHAAVRTKEKVWDSNELSIEAAVSAVDQWEAAYNALRSLIVQSVHSAAALYDAAKEGAGQLEHGLLMPVRDWILLPAFMLTERACSETVHFLQSPAARTAADQTLQVARQVPVVGPNLLAPGLYFHGRRRPAHVARPAVPHSQQGARPLHGGLVIEFHQVPLDGHGARNQPVRATGGRQHYPHPVAHAVEGIGQRAVRHVERHQQGICH